MSDDHTFSVECDCGRTLHIQDQTTQEEHTIQSWPKELTKLGLLVVGGLGNMVNGVTDHVIGLIQLKSNPAPEQAQKPEPGSGMLNED